MSKVEKEAIAEAKAVILEHTPWIVNRRAFRSAYHVRLLQEDDRRDPEQDWSEDREQNFVEFSAHVSTITTRFSAFKGDALDIQVACKEADDPVQKSCYGDIGGFAHPFSPEHDTESFQI